MFAKRVKSLGIASVTLRFAFLAQNGRIWLKIAVLKLEGEQERRHDSGAGEGTEGQQGRPAWRTTSRRSPKGDGPRKARQL